MLKPLIIWGAAGHARVLHEFAGALGYELCALFDRAEVPSPVAGIPVYRGQESLVQWLESHEGSKPAAMVAIGGASGRDRLELQEYLSGLGLDIVTAIHPTAFVAGSVALGKGCQVLAQSAVCAGARVGAGCIINTRASVDHECELADGVHVAPGATLAGCVRVGQHSMISAGAVVLPRICIGADAIVGAGAVVTRDVPDRAVVAGNPARFLRWQT